MNTSVFLDVEGLVGNGETKENNYSGFLLFYHTNYNLHFFYPFYFLAHVKIKLNRRPFTRCYFDMTILFETELATVFDNPIIS